MRQGSSRSVGPAIARHAHIHDVATDDINELARIVEDRTRPIGVDKRSGVAADVDAFVSKIMAISIPRSFAV